MARPLRCLLLLAPALAAASERRLDELPAALRPLSPTTNRQPFDRVVRPVAEGQTVVFLGGTAVTDQDRYGYLETLLAVAWADWQPRFRNLAWQADTVYRQQRPRFFYTENHFQEGEPDARERLPADLVLVQFGKAESLDGLERLDEFREAYAQLLGRLKRLTPRVIVVLPSPFQHSGPASHLVGERNGVLMHYVTAVRELARQSEFPVVDLFRDSPLDNYNPSLISRNGVHLSAAGHWNYARKTVFQLGLADAIPPIAYQSRRFSDPAQFADPRLEQLRQEIVAKNRLWFQYFRPTNWAFLYGNRQQTPSSWHFRDKQRRWFPGEVASLLPMLEQAESRIRALANSNNTVEAELQSFRVEPGYQINLFADERDGIANPVAMHWDPRGRLWVLCTLAYAQLAPGATANDKLIVLEDTDGDGRADRSQVFADQLNMPTGFALAEGGVYLGQGTDLWFLADRDGDDRVDQRRLVFTGFGTDDTHQNINSFCWTPGGALMFCQGMHAFSRIETPWGIRRADWSAVWEFDPQRLRLQPYLSPNLSADNPWGIAFDRWGEMYLKGNDKQIYDAWPAMVPTTHVLKMEAAYGLVGRTAAKSMAVDVVETAHLPEEMQGCLLVAGYFDRVIERFRPYRTGSGIASRRMPQFITSSHPAFRPVDLRIGPDGAIYIADWFNPIINHYQVSLRHPERDKLHGRIWRVTAQDRPLVRPPELEGASVAELLDCLRHRERWVRQQAKRVLAERPAETLFPRLQQWIAALPADDPDNDHARVEALGVYQSHHRVEPELLNHLLRSPHPRARAYATRVVGRWQAELPAPLELLRQRVADAHPRVRLQAVVAASHIPRAEAIGVAAEVLEMPLDPPLEYALRQTVHALAPHWLPALARGEPLFADRSEQVAFVLRTLGSEEAAAVLRQTLGGSDLSADLRRQTLGHLVHVGNAEDLTSALQQVHQHPSLLEELCVAARQRRLSPAGDVTPELRRLLQSGDAAVRQRAIRLAGFWRVAEMATDAARLAGAVTQPAAVRVAAVEAVADLGGAAAADQLRRWIEDPLGDVRGAAAVSLCRVDLDSGVEAVANQLHQTESEADAARLLLPLLELRQGSAQLAAAIQRRGLPKPVAIRLSRLLSGAGRGDTELQTTLAGLTGLDRGSTEYSAELVQALLHEARSQGDAEAGRRVFFAQASNCAACHRIDGAGGDQGPDLSVVARGLAPELIVEAVLWPDRQVKEGYAATRIYTARGTVVQGYIEGDRAADPLTVRDPSSGQVTRVPRDEIDEQAESVTLMPSELARTMTRAELRDLIRFLLSTGG